ncbi:uncharacterized protein THITE_2052012, partial [Thermothielavioides terrestris NRRL 8126]
RGIPSKRKSSACVDYVPALCTHRPSLLPIEWLSEAFGLAQRGRQRPLRAGKLSKLGHLEENSVNHRIFERTLRPPAFRRACLSERHFDHQAPGLCWGPAAARRPRKPVARSSNHLAQGVLRVPAVKRKATPQRLTSDQVGGPAELKHINKRRKRNQQGLP